jgi:hypothetical protein
MLVDCGLDGSEEDVADEVDAAARTWGAARWADTEGRVAAAVARATVTSRGPRGRGVLGHSTI